MKKILLLLALSFSCLAERRHVVYWEEQVNDSLQISHRIIIADSTEAYCVLDSVQGQNKSIVTIDYQVNDAPVSATTH